MLKFIVLLFSMSVFSQTLVGVSETDKKLSLSLKEFNFFTYEEGYRYGYGSSGIDIGDKFRLKLKSAGGTPFYGFNNGIAFFLEAGNVDVVWSGYENERSYYALMPGMGIGYFLRGKAYEIFFVPKAGLAVTNFFSHRFLRPGTKSYYGGQAAIAIEKKFFGSLDLIRFDSVELKTITVGYRLSDGMRLVFNRTINFVDRPLSTNQFLFLWDIP